ncbi:MAG: hypothetical protein KDH96_03805, partial [Candidatus Riesia sp.]|nr:hypothetical protein [Candidatus Riesia sp.]
MYLKLWSGDDPYLSYRIYKNPSSDYARKFGKRKVFGTYTLEQDTLVYNVIVDNDYKQFIEHHKQLNSFSYLHHTLNSVTNYTLYLISEVFRSALKKQYPSEIEEHYMDYHSYDLTIGPFCTPIDDFFIDMCLDIGLRVITLINDEYSYNLHFQTEAMQFNAFLQKVFITTYCLVSNVQDMSILHKDAVEKMKLFTDNWLNNFSEDKYKQWIIKRLSGYKPTFAELFMEDDRTIKEKEVFKSTHEKRHEIILSITKEFNNFIDVGCNTGTLDYILIGQNKDRNILGIDSDDWKIRKARKNKRVKKSNKKSLSNAYYSGLNFLTTNAIYPILNEYAPMECMICSEFIEHLTLDERIQFYNMVMTFYKPRTLILSTPNYEYNQYYGGLVNDDGSIGYRHKDHKIEFTYEELLNELCECLVIKNLSTHHLYDNEHHEPISFILKLDLSVDDSVDNWWQTLLNKQFPEKREQLVVNNGLCSNHFNKDIFYLGETISPVDGQNEDVESIEKAVELVDEAVIEIKEMGSRGYILWFN